MMVQVGTYSFLAKLFVLGLVLLTSFLLVELILSSASYALAALGIRAVRDTGLEGASLSLLTIAASAFIGVMFTIPLALSLVGHAGSWIRHVASRSAEPLGVMLLLAFAVFLAGTAGSGLALNFAGVGSGVETAFVIALIGFLLLAFVSPSRLIAGLGIVVDASATTPSAIADRLWPKGRKDYLVSIELRTVPLRQIRDKERPERLRTETIRFQRLVQGLSTLDCRIEFHLRFRAGRGQVLFHARCRHSDAAQVQERLLAVVKAYLPEFSAGALQNLGLGDPEAAESSVAIIGVPEAAENPLEPVSRYFLESGYSGDYRVVLENARVNPFRKALARREQKKLAEKAAQQLTRQSTLQNEQQTTSVRDYVGEVGLEESLKSVERHESSLVVRCQVFVTGRAKASAAAKSMADGASSVLIGSLSSHRSGSALRTSGVRGSVGGDEALGRDALMLPKEVVPFIWIPQTALGTELAPSTEFELPPKLEGEIELGKIVVHSSLTGHEARVPVDTLTKHCFFTGMTGTGKTTSCFGLLVQLHRLGVPFLVVEPVKSEYRSLLAHIPNLQVFTLGDEDTAPFRLNIFEPPRDVKVQTHLENLEAAWTASFVMYAPLPYVVKEVLAETYKASGWDVRKNKRGRPITLDDFRTQSERVSRRLGYEPKVLMDIEAALKTRITSLSLGGKGPMFNTVASIPMDDLLRRPTVIELKNIQNNEEKAFVAALVLTNIVEYIESKGSSKQLRHLTLIEEAHRLLPNISSQKGDPESADPRKRMVEQFANMLAEVRAYGEGLAIVEQIPTKIIPDAIKNTATKVAHRVPAADDREVLAGAMNLTKRQEGVFTALKPGEAIVSLERHPLPIRVQVPNVIERIGLPLGEIGDEEVKRHMTEFYLRNPLPKAPGSILSRKIMLVVDAEWFRARFLEGYKEWVRTGNTKPLVGFLVTAAESCSDEEDEELEIASRMLSLAVASYLPFDESDREKFPRMFMQEVKKSVRGDDRARR
jgi:DNA helicase HerA-like ATPase